MTLYYNEKNSCYRIDINRVVGTGALKQRVRTTKQLPKNITREQAQAVHDQMENELFVRQRLTVMAHEWPAYVASQAIDKQSWLHKTLRHCKSRSEKRGFSFSLNVADIEYLLLRSKGRCEVTGIAFHVNSQTNGKVKPYFHSLDRIDSNKGYYRANCRIVCYAVNVAMLHWGEDVFSNMAVGFVINKFCSLGLAHHLKA